MIARGTWWWAFAVAWLAVACGARAQMAVGGHANGARANEHAWAVTPSTVSSEWGLWHIPPRFGRGGADDGEVRIVDSLERAPAGMAASGGRVWMAFAGSGNRAGYGLLTAAVQRGSIDGTWFTGTGGRLASAAFLPTRGRLAGMAGGPRGPVVLVDSVGQAAQIAWLERGAWRWANGPADDGPAASAVGVLADGTVALAALEPGAIVLWRANLPPLEASERGYELIDPDAILTPGAPGPAEPEPPVDLDWTSERASLPEGMGFEVDAATLAGGPVGIGSRVVLTLEQQGRVHVLEVDGGRVREVYAAPRGGVALLAAGRRGVIVRLADEAEGAQGRAATRLVLDEFSLDTGRALYRGPAVFDGPISSSDIRILLVLMILVSATLLLFVVRTSGESEPFTPPVGCALAPPMPRLMASVADGLLALLLGGELARLLPEGWLAIRVGAEMLDFAPLFAALALGFVAGSVLEATTGRTPGKLIFGLFVSRSGEADGVGFPPRRPGLGASLARNAVKWLLPLVALAGATSPALRHRGDTMTGLGVIGQAAPDADRGHSDQDRQPDDR